MTDFNDTFGKMEAKLEERKKSINHSKIKGVDAVIQYDVSGHNGGHFYIQVADGNLSITKAAHSNPNITLHVSDDDFNDLLEDRLSGGAAMFTGKLKIKGDLKLLTKLRKVMA